MKSGRRRIDVNLDELDQVLDGARQAPLSEADYDKLKGALHALAAMLVRPRTTEKTSAVLEERKNRKPTAGLRRMPRRRAPDTDAMAPRRLPARRRSRLRIQTCTHGDRCPECRKGQCIRAEGAEGAGPDRRTGAVGGDRLLAGALALRRLRAGVHSARTGRRGSGKVRRDGGGDDRAAQVRQRDSRSTGWNNWKRNWGFRCRQRRSGRLSKKQRS